MEFDENSDRFRVCGGIHIKYVASFCAVFGICATLGVFCFGLYIFPWYLYEDSVNTTAKIAFCCFLIGGCSSHGLILYSLYSTRLQTQWLMPAFAYHLFIAVLNAITSLIAVGELFSEGNISHRDSVMAKIVLVVCPTIFVIQMIGFYVIIKCRTYIQCKRRHVRNGEPPRIREVTMMTNKVSIMELSFDQFNETMYSPA
ncbi:hypothetical protein GCK72_005959 [Caenorhabditis remanei]|uniref:Uncharacterized protein n=1 Tax=Caenorhabditis remanei TaxID=31234 RepID=A0A6A5HH45_CAERE|nr:hypothetical protein GCK72_005959 [Caenorhabditis remanei]KAF1766004.1 hypothetical protein GCK72_005959 [Caenorhabditis remanei]